jgi:hypothetical protein
MRRNRKIFSAGLETISLMEKPLPENLHRIHTLVTLQ